MKSFATQENRLMPRDQRLQEAYRQIIFIADHGFNQDPKYKRANQVLYARIKRLEETVDLERPRLVTDVIPDSNLAKYGNYQYNESRERTYTATNDFPRIHLPCPRQHKPPRNHTVNHAREHNPGDTSVNHACRKNSREIWMLPEVEQIFVHILFTNSFNFNLYEAELERFEDKIESFDESGGVEGCCNGDFHQVTPVLGHLFDRTPGRLANYSREDLVGTLPYYFNVKEYEDVLLRKRILSDVVRELWSRPKLENYEKSVKVHKSSLENVLVEEENFKYPNALKLVDTDKSLQVLVNSMCFMNEKLKKLDVVTVQQLQQQQQPTAKKVEKQQQQPELVIAPTTKRLYSDVVQGNNKAKSNLVHQEQRSERSVATTTPFVSLDTSTASSTTSGVLGGESCGEVDVEKQVKYSYSDVVNGSGGTDGTNLVFLNEFTNERNFQNCYTPVQYLPQSYRFGGYQVPRSGSIPVPQPWLVPSYRGGNLCGNYGNFLGQILVPQMPTKHRWSTGYPPTRTQNQGVFQTPVVFSPASTPLTTKKKNLQKFSKKKQPVKVCKSQGSDIRLMSRKSCEGNSTRSSAVADDEEEAIPVGFSASEELERIALREYQAGSPSSEEIFFREIERQAEEQYDGNPENSPRPPIRAKLGGLAIHFCFLLRFIDAFVSTFSVNVTSRIRQKLD